MAVVYFQCLSVKPSDNSSSYHESNALHTKGAIYYIFIIYNIFTVTIPIRLQNETELLISHILQSYLFKYKYEKCKKL